MLKLYHTDVTKSADWVLQEEMDELMKNADNNPFMMTERDWKRFLLLNDELKKRK